MSLLLRSSAPEDGGGRQTNPADRWLCFGPRQIGIWALVALVASGETLFLESGPEPRWSPLMVLLCQLPNYGTWALLTPLILRLGRSLPIFKPAWFLPVAVHILISVLVASLHRPLVMLTWAPLMGRWNEAGVDWAWIGRGAMFSLHTDVLIYWTILGLGTAIRFYASDRSRALQGARLEMQLSRARLEGLAMQLHPHFFFNTLHTVGALIRKDRKDDAIQVIAGLGELVHETMSSDPSCEVALHREMAFNSRYLEIEKIRFGDRLRIFTDIDSDAESAMVPNLLLQPVLENALKHGVSKNPEGGEIRIRASSRPGEVLIEVDNTGPGDTVSGQDEPGIGLRNVRERLEVHYGDRASLQFHPLHDGGGRVSIKIPQQERAVR